MELSKIQEAIYDELGIEDVELSTKLRELVTDSLEMVALLQRFEDLIGRDISDEEAEKLFTIEDILRFANGSLCRN